MSPSPAQRLDEAALRAWPLPLLAHDGDKESRGRVVIVAGSREIPGAAILAAKAALRAGAGKVLLATAESVAMSIAVAVPELRVVPLPETPQGGIDPAGVARLKKFISQAGALLIGPGMQDEAATCALVQAVRECCPQVTLILDALAMGAACGKPVPGEPMLLTPHAGEMAHLTGDSKESVLADPRAAACKAAQQWNSIVALKGASTFIAHPEGTSWVHEADIVGLATAGSGDVLAGLITGLVARGAALDQAAAWGVAVHARAGQRLAKRVAGLGYLASELPAEFPALLERWGASAPAVD